MAKIFKISGYLVDSYGAYDSDYIQAFLNGVNANGDLESFFTQHMHVEESEEFDWDDELPINYENCDLAHCEAYFKPAVDYDGGSLERGFPKPGEIWKHFKEGKEVKIVAVSLNSEHPSQVLVTYECPNGMYTRPMDMFLSKTDKKKYPDATQEWRFELVKPDTTVLIEELELSVRAFNVLKRAGIATLSDICNLTVSDLKNIRYMGRHSLEEIVSKLSERGLSLKEEIE